MFNAGSAPSDPRVIGRQQTLKVAMRSVRYVVLAGACAALCCATASASDAAGELAAGFLLHSQLWTMFTPVLSGLQTR